MELQKKIIKGKCKWFSQIKGFGFLTLDPEFENQTDKVEDIFFHFSSIEVEGFKTLNEGQEVEFEITKGKDGRLQAVHIVPINNKF